MKIKIFLLIMFSITLWGEEEGFCIQALSYSSKDISKKIILKIKKVKNRFDFARIEKRNKYYIFRIGKYETEYSAKNDLRGVKRFFPYSYIRRCDYDKSKFIELKKTVKLLQSPKIKKQIKFNPKKKIKLKVDIEPKIIKENHYNQNGIDLIIQKQEKTGKEITKKYNSNNILKGVYLKAQTENLEKNSLSLEYKLFDGGFFEAEKKEKKSYLNSMVEIYESLKRLKNYSIAQKSDYLQNVKSRLNYFFYLNLKHNYLQLLRIKKRELGDVWEIKELKNEIENINLYIELYKKSGKANIGGGIYRLINNIEYLDLIEKKQIIAMVLANDYELKRQDILMKEQQLIDNWWSEHLKVNVYAKGENIDNLQKKSIGAVVEIPLGSDKNRDELIKLKQLSQKNEKTALKIRTREIISLLYDKFIFQKQKIKILKNELSLLMDRYMIASLKKMSSDKNIKLTKDDEMIDINILKQKHKIILRRFELYKVVINLQILANSHQIVKSNKVGF